MDLNGHNAATSGPHHTPHHGNGAGATPAQRHPHPAVRRVDRDRPPGDRHADGETDTRRQLIDNHEGIADAFHELADTATGSNADALRRIAHHHGAIADVLHVDTDSRVRLTLAELGRAYLVDMLGDDAEPWQCGHVGHDTPNLCPDPWAAVLPSVG